VTPVQRATVAGPGGPLRIAYTAHGQGRPVVLIHGMGSWREIWPALAWPGYRFYALDLPGFGDSDLPRRRQRLADFGITLAAWVAALGLPEPPLLVGHSFGAMVAVDAAAHRLDAAGLVLVAPAGFIDPVGAMEGTRLVALNRLLIWVTGSDWFGRRMVRALGLDPDGLDLTLRRSLQRGWRRAREMARMGRFYRYPAMRADLEATGLPHRILVGTRDALFPRHVLEPALAGLSVEWLEGLGHIPLWQDPVRFEQRLRAAVTALYPPAESPA
jgi:pimeloyl-ACP methyl ester carboxylesterase